jgi:hypothetical protein
LPMPLENAGTPNTRPRPIRTVFQRKSNPKLKFEQKNSRVPCPGFFRVGSPFMLGGVRTPSRFPAPTLELRPDSPPLVSVLLRFLEAPLLKVLALRGSAGRGERDPRYAKPSPQG